MQQRRYPIMTLRYLRSGITAIVIAGGVAVGLVHAQQRDGGLLPLHESGMVTVAGCLMRGDQVRGGDDDKFVLANLHTGIASVPEHTCTADAGATAVQLDNPKKGNVNDSMLGRWVEVHGRLEKETSTDEILRELDVASARLLPVVIPSRAAAPAIEPSPEPPAFEAAAPEPVPEPAVAVATSGVLPKTASFAPVTGLVGLFACAAGIVLWSFRSRQRG
jgi:hypothetical protein